MNILTDKQIAYLAAAIDFEGSIKLNSVTIPKATGVMCTFAVEVGNTSFALLNHLQHITGLGIIYPRPKQKGWKQAFIWSLRVHEMRDFLEAIQNDLVIKRTQCEILLEYMNHAWSNPLTEDQNTLRRVMLSEMKELNKRGTDD
jgi:hypothetical protein